MKSLKIILGLVYVILIALLFLFSCKGCKKDNTNLDDEDITETVKETPDIDDIPNIEENDPDIDNTDPVEVTDNISEEEQQIIDDANEIGESGDLKITLLWEYAADMDLHILEPGGFHIYHAAKQSPTGGMLDHDNIPGGPGSAENVYWVTPPAGTYRIFVRYYSSSGPLPGNCKVVVQQRDKEPRIYDLHFTQPKEDIYIPDVVVK